MRFNELKVVLRLVRAHIWTHPARLIFTVVSTIVSAAVVVWIVSGYDALANKFDDFAEGYIGRYELILLPERKAGQFGGLGPMSGGGLPAKAIELLQSDPEVAEVEPALQVRRRIVNPRAPSDENEFGAPTSAIRGKRPPATPSPAEMAQRMARFSRQPTLVGTDSKEPPHALVEGRWINRSARDPVEGVMTSGSAEMLGVKLGSEVTVSGGRDRQEMRVKIVGLAAQPKTLPPPKFMIGLPPSRDAALRGGPAGSALYVARDLAAGFAVGQPTPSYAGIHLKPGVDPAALQQRWAERLSNLQPPVELQSLANVEAEIDNSTTAEVVRAQALSATGIALLAALFIIYTTISMGVSERIRQFAVLRAVALARWHITAMIAIESLFLGLIGWAGGLAAGWALLRTIGALRPEVMGDNAALGWWCVILSGLCALGGSLAAAILPAWEATRVSPLDAMGPRRRIEPARLSRWATLAGVALICLNPVLVFWVPMADTARYVWSAAVGCTAMALGFVLLAPLAVVVCERFCGPLMARVLRIPPGLLSTQLTTNLWRTVGTSIALTLGLGLFVSMQTWGYSMLGPFYPGTWVPELLVVMNPGLPDSEIEAVRHVKGVRPDQFVPVAAKQVKLTDDVTGFAERTSAAQQDTCVMVGVDLDSLRGTNPLFPLEFVEGSRDEAVARLGQGRFCLVPDHFARESGLSVGDKFAVLVAPERGPLGRGGRAAAGARAAATPAEQPHNRKEYEIAGVVSMPGWHWMSKQGFRQGRAAGLFFADFGQVRSDFAIDRTTLFWMNLDGTADEEAIQVSMKEIAARNYDPAVAERMDGGGAARGPGFGRRTAGATVTLRSAEAVRTQIRERADGIIWALSQLPLVTLAVTSLSVINAVLASVRARRWELGVLRAGPRAVGARAADRG